MEEIYLDHAATTPVDRRVIDVMYPIYTEVFGNPSSIHRFGRQARQHLDYARQTIGASIGAEEKEIFFTSGGTESDNLALIGTARANKQNGNHIITTEQEHHAVLDAAKHLEKTGFRVTYLPVYEDGLIRTEDLAAALTEETILVSVMYVNNETGVIQPIKEIGTMLKDHQAYFHTDAVQAYGLLEINVQACGIDLLTASAHKINGPKGIGFLYASHTVGMDPRQFGGEQERKRRPGTENAAGAAGFGEAVKIAVRERADRAKKLAQFKEQFLAVLEAEGICHVLNGYPDAALASIVNISFPGVHVEALLTNLDLAKVAASGGSACTAGTVEPSHVLSGMFGKGNERTVNSIRFSFGSENTADNVEEAARRTAKIIKRLTT
jgi:cysteine desulfurase